MTWQTQTDNTGVIKVVRKFRYIYIFRFIRNVGVISNGFDGSRIIDFNISNRPCMNKYNVPSFIYIFLKLSSHFYLRGCVSI